MAELRQDVEHWFLARGTPHFIEGYSRRRDITRTLPVLTLVFLVEMGSALNADWRWWQNVLAILGGAAVLLGSWAAINRLRGRRALARPVAVTRVDMAVFVLVPAFLPVLFGGQLREALALAAVNVLILLAVVYLGSYGLVTLLRWAIRKMVGQLRAVFGLLARALPMLLLIVALLLFTPEVWQVAANLEGPYLAATLGLLFAMGVGFLLTRLPGEIARLGQVESDEALAALCDGTPAAGCSDGVDPSPLPLSRHERGNVALVVVVSQGIQVMLVAIVMGLFFVLFGLVAIRPEVVLSWVQKPELDAIFTWGNGEDVVLTGELIRVALFLAAFSGFYFTVYVITDETYRREFFDEVVAEVRQALAVRTVYLRALVPNGLRGAAAPGGALPPPPGSVSQPAAAQTS